MLLYVVLVTIGLGLVVGLLGMTIAHFRPKRRDTIEGKHVLVSKNMYRNPKLYKNPSIISMFGRKNN
jgi:hypothetical protein